MARYRIFCQDFSHAPIYYKAETKFCVSICVHAIVQTKRPTASKFGIDFGESFSEDLDAIFLEIVLDFLE